MILTTFQWPHNRSHFSFIDLIKGIIPYKLPSSLQRHGLSTNILRTLLGWIQTSCWDLIWTPRTSINFYKHMVLLRLSKSPRQDLLSVPILRRWTSGRRIRSRIAFFLVMDYMTFGKRYPFRWCINYLLRCVPIFWQISDRFTTSLDVG